MSTIITMRLMLMLLLLILAQAQGASAMATVGMLVNQPTGGDKLNLAQPTYDWGPRGPATLRSYYHWQNHVSPSQAGVDMHDIGLTKDEIAFDMPHKVRREEFESLPSAPPTVHGLSEERIVNYAMLIAQQREVFLALEEENSAEGR